MGILDEGYSEYTLENGLLVAMQKTNSNTIYGGVNVWCGALNEEKGEEGLAHFLEHCILSCGTEKYSPEEVEGIQRRFGYINASTNINNIVFSVGMLPEDLKIYFDFISDAIVNPRLDERVVEQERQRVLREIADYKSVPGYKDCENYKELVHGKDSPYLRNPFGEEDVVIEATVDDLRKIHERHFYAANSRIILAGNLPENIDELIAPYFGNMSRGECKKVYLPLRGKIKNICMYSYSPYLINEDNPAESSAVFNLNMYAAPAGTEETRKVEMMNNLLGGGADSRLFKRISKELGFAYSIDSSYSRGKNYGNIVISGKIPPSKFDEIMDVVFQEMRTMQEELESQERLDMLKRNALYDISQWGETNQDRVEIIASSLEYGNTPEIILKQVNAITLEDVRDMANKYLPSSRDDGIYAYLLRDPLKEYEK